jgi:hypothetical protein
MLLQLLAVALERDAIILAGLAIATHAVYGVALLVSLPYMDPAQDFKAQGSFKLTDLDALALFHCCIQMVILALGMVATGENGAVVTAAVLALFMVGTAATAWVFMRIRRRSRVHRKTLEAGALNIVKASVQHSL